MKPKILTNLKIREVSSVDRGASEGVEVLLMKRDEIDGEVPEELDEPMAKAVTALRMSVSSIIGDGELDDVEKQDAIDETFGQYHEHIEELHKAKAKKPKDEADDPDEDDGTEGMDETESDAGLGSRTPAHGRQRQSLAKTEDEVDSYLTIAKAVAEGTSPSPVSRKVFYDELNSRAQAARGAGQTEAQAFAKFLETPDGAVLYAALKRAPEDAAEPAPVVKTTTPEPTPSYRKLMALADVERKANPAMSREQAFAKIYESPENGELVQAAKAEHRAVAVTAQRAA